MASDPAKISRFLCDQCDEEFPLLEVVAQHGIFFLIGKEDGYYGLVCPDCLHTTLKSANKGSLESIRKSIFEEAGKSEGAEYTRLQYNSFPYHMDYLPEVSTALIHKQIKVLSGTVGTFTESDFGGTGSTGSRGYCSYGFGDLVVGPSAAVYWFNEKRIRDLVKIENKTRLKVFPRYVFHDSLSVAVQTFCWKYNTESNPVSELELSAYPEFESRDAQYGDSVERDSEFLVLLKHAPLVQDARSITGGKEARDNPKKVMGLWDKLLDGYDGKEIQRTLSYHADQFIHQVYKSACRTDFSTSDISDIRNKCIRDISARFSTAKGTSDMLSAVGGALLEYDPSLEEKSFIGLATHQKSRKSIPTDDKGLPGNRSFAAASEREAIPGQGEILDKVKNLEKSFSSLRKIVTRNTDLMELKYKISEVAKFNTDVLILGETGTGKELFAHAIHQLSGRPGKFAAVNCSAIPKDLFESELFGHRKGAFSGAYLDKQGAFEYANQGTLFLDEIGEMPLEMQAKVLRAVEYRTINRVGSMDAIHLDLRIIFATNRDLKKEADEGRFRKDLFFRIFSPSFRIIPLRERIEDIPLLVEHFLDICNEKFEKNVESVSPDLMGIFKKYTWDGNVRELMKVIEMGVINSAGSQISEKEISYFSDLKISEQGEPADRELPPASKITDEDIKYWMEKLNFNKSQVARRLGVSYRTILRRSKAIYQ
jgi:transcriptional regulator with PAS, ATPase and Fis domain